MTLIETSPAIESTSAAGAMLPRPLREPVLLGMMLVGLGTSTCLGVPTVIDLRLPPGAQQTSSGMSVMLVERAGAAIAELRRLSGLTWDQLARLFNVSRRALHFWASGKAMTPGNEEHLQRILAVLRKVDRGSVAANRTALLAVRDDGIIPFDLLTEGRYDGAIAVLGGSEGVVRARSPRMSMDAKVARTPRPPEELADALQDRVHRETGSARAAKSVRTRSGH